MYYIDSFTLALALTVLIILGLKWLTLSQYERTRKTKQADSNIAKELRVKYLTVLDHLKDNPYDESLLDSCYELGHQLYERTIITDDTFTIASQSRAKIDKDIQRVYKSLSKKSA